LSRISGSSEFVESTLNVDGKVDESQLSGPTKQVQIVRARALIRPIVARGLSNPGSQAAERLDVDRSAIRRAAQKVRNNTESILLPSQSWSRSAPTPK